MSETAISVEGLSKLYRIGVREQLHETLGGAAIDFLRSPVRNYRRLRGLSAISPEEESSEDVISALSGVDLEVAEGHVLGLIGSNGAGKTTLLKILAGITEPTSGRALVRGRIASLLEVGTGFHPELTGRENVYLNGTILGMTKREIDRKFEEIVEFSGVRRFLDTPVKRYSSGMRVRLAFAVAAHLEPEILLIDEVLAVGDAEFQRKCIGKMGEVARAGRTVLFVSHNMNAVKALCTEVCWLGEGAVVQRGAPLDVVASYLEDGLVVEEERRWNEEDAPGNEELRLLGARVVPGSDGRVYMGDGFDLEFTFVKPEAGAYGVDLTFHLMDEMGNLVFVGSTVYESESWELGRGRHVARARIPEDLMNEGLFSVARLIFLKDKGSVIFEERDVLRFEIVNPGEQRMGWISRRKEGVVRPRIEWSCSASEGPPES